MIQFKQRKSDKVNFYQMALEGEWANMLNGSTVRNKLFTASQMSPITAQLIQSYFIYLWIEENQFEEICRAIPVSWCLPAVDSG